MTFKAFENGRRFNPVTNVTPISSTKDQPAQNQVMLGDVKMVVRTNNLRLEWSGSKRKLLIPISNVSLIDYQFRHNPRLIIRAILTAATGLGLHLCILGISTAPSFLKEFSQTTAMLALIAGVGFVAAYILSRKHKLRILLTDAKDDLEFSPQHEANATTAMALVEAALSKRNQQQVTKAA